MYFRVESIYYLGKLSIVFIEDTLLTDQVEQGILE